MDTCGHVAWQIKNQNKTQKEPQKAICRSPSHRVQLTSSCSGVQSKTKRNCCVPNGVFMSREIVLLAARVPPPRGEPLCACGRDGHIVTQLLKRALSYGAKLKHICTTVQVLPECLRLRTIPAVHCNVATKGVSLGICRPISEHIPCHRDILPPRAYLLEVRLSLNSFVFCLPWLSCDCPSGSSVLFCQESGNSRPETWTRLHCSE